ncbi:hypothetical protein F0562_017508 [Nyssa sinensis]|uniref:Uncharacterized protein n=1 Tax=Nyssa sinensis TaxID=561372 RepID=A0A5J4ZFF5_9ASTE|nr:hypothetical protein F0562_017508 [Nyssa sinensis]
MGGRDEKKKANLLIDSEPKSGYWVIFGDDIMDTTYKCTSLLPSSGDMHCFSNLIHCIPSYNSMKREFP